MAGFEPACVRVVLLLALVTCVCRAWGASSINVALSGSSVQFTLVAGSTSNAGNTPITSTTTWSLGPPNTLNLYAYFGSSSAALTDGLGHNIPSSGFLISDNSGVSTALTATTPYGVNDGLRMESIGIAPGNKTGTVNDTMQFNINLAALSQLPAGTYTGILYIQAQAAGPGNVQSVAQPIAVTATLPESLGISLSASSVSFTLAAGGASNPGNATVTANTKWVLKPSRTAVTLYAYFSSSSAALTSGNGDSIPTSAFSISDNGGAARTCTNTVPFGGANAGLTLATTTLSSSNENSARSDAMTFNIDLSGGTLPQLPAGTYAGTLNIQARATP